MASTLYVTNCIVLHYFKVSYNTISIQHGTHFLTYVVSKLKLYCFLWYFSINKKKKKQQSFVQYGFVLIALNDWSLYLCLHMSIKKRQQIFLLLLEQYSVYVVSKIKADLNLLKWKLFLLIIIDHVLFCSAYIIFKNFLKIVSKRGI